ncbi:histidine phosphatase family protein [Pseudomonas plecoglossicida]|uniref:histidine phosphatase family protein n=1 Tax=Pseudomonas plecoglossicida TaxID=70775 RepID=UPI003D255CC5
MKATHLTLICHAPTQAQRLGRFHVDGEGLQPITAQPLALPPGASSVTGPELRATQTASLLGLQPAVELALRDCDLGRWKGMSLKTLQGDEPDLLQAWMTDPGSAPHGGESIAELCQRVGRWLDGFTAPGHWVAVTHPMVIRAAMLHVLQCPVTAFHRIDVQPLAPLHLGHYGMWRVRLASAD